MIVDPLGYVACEPYSGKSKHERAILYVCSDEYVHWLFASLASMNDQSDCKGFAVYVACVGNSRLTNMVCEYFDVSAIQGNAIKKRCRHTKSIVYSAASLIPEDFIVCADADLIYCDEWDGIWSQCEEFSVKCVHDMQYFLLCNVGEKPSLRNALIRGLYYRRVDKWNIPQRVLDSELVINDGVITSRRKTMLEMESYMRSWLAERVPYSGQSIGSNQWVINAVALDMGILEELPRRYNCMITASGRQTWQGSNIRHYVCDKFGPNAGRDERVSILHYANKPEKVTDIRDLYMKQYEKWRTDNGL